MTETGADSAALAPAAPEAGGMIAYVMALAMALTDLFVISQWLTGSYPTLTALAYHFAASATYAFAARFLLGQDSAEVAANTVFLVLLGPLGGIVLLVLEIAGGGGAGNLESRRDAVLQGPPPTAAEKLCLDIRQNRRPLLDGTLPESFFRVLDGHDITRQYAVIATISRHYTPEMLPALRHALASPVPVLRVQAAAVFARLRGDFEERATRLLQDGGPPATAAAADAQLRDLHSVARSGFVEPALAARLLQMAAELQGRAAAAPGGPGTGGSGRRPAADAPLPGLTMAGMFKGAG